MGTSNADSGFEVNEPCFHASGIEPGCASCWEGTAWRANVEVERLRALVVRLWCSDSPDDSTTKAIDAWVDGLPLGEAQALNVALNERFGSRDAAR